MSRFLGIVAAIIAGSASCAVAQPAFSTVPTQAVYEYQLNYQLPWQRWYGGPGWSIGGTMPTQGVFGYSTLNGIPLPPPLGAGVYVNAPAPNAANLMGGPGPGFGPGLGIGSGVGLGPMASPGPMAGSGNAMASQAPFMSGFAGSTSSGGVPQRPTQARHERPAVPMSPPGSRRASMEQQSHGDQKLRHQQWGQAYVHYRNAVDLAPERPEAHFRLGLTFTALKQYASAIREFKRSLDLDPSLPQSGEMISTIFGGDSKTWKATVIPQVADWVREDVRDTARLLLLGLLLHFDDDPRGSEILEAARRTPGADNYVMAFLSPTTPGADTKSSSRLPSRSPFKSDAGRDRSADDLPLPPAPAPFSGQDQEPFPDPPPT